MPKPGVTVSFRTPEASRTTQEPEEEGRHGEAWLPSSALPSYLKMLAASAEGEMLLMGQHFLYFIIIIIIIAMVLATMQERF